jgi:protein-S-isoprenylcysteine O-methyltransferase Ste14
VGKRGEGWVILQFFLFAIILFIPQIPDVMLPTWVRGLGALILVAGGIFGTWGFLSLGKNLTAVPKPIEGGQLITKGAYAFVRHPIYTGIILGTLGWALLRSNLLGAALAAAAFVFFDLKSRQEELWLTDAYEGYPAYQRKVRKLIPWVY